MLSRLKRLALALLLAVPLLGGSLGSADAQAADAATFVSSLAQRAIPVLTRAEIPPAEREQQFRKLLHEGFDLNQIARLVLGRYWNQASQAERAEFVELLEDYLVQLYAARFADFENVTLRVESVRDEQGQTIVRSVLMRPEAPPVALDWRVERDQGRFLITDLVVEGISMIITQRSEFASVIRQKGGRVQGLLELLRQKTRS